MLFHWDYITDVITLKKMLFRSLSARMTYIRLVMAPYLLALDIFSSCRILEQIYA